MITRLNKGKPAGTYLAQLGAWALYETAEGRCKVASIQPVNGKANYAFGVKDGRISTHTGLDCTLLREERPELFRSVEAYLKEQVEPKETITTQQEADPYGDLALSRRHRLTPEQNWKRGLLNMRRIEMEHAAVKRESVWESAVRMLWAGVFGTKITEDDLQGTLRWITQRQGDVDITALLQLEQDYYAGRLAPRSCEMLEARLNDLTSIDFENVEEKDNEQNLRRAAVRREPTNERDTQRMWHQSNCGAAAVEDPYSAFH